MPSIYSQYSRGIRTAFGGYWATRLPNVPLDIGALGTVDDGVFVPRSHLGSFGISFDVRSSPGVADYLQHTSGNAVSIRFKSHGN
jgi:hypothetical protein